MGQGATAEECFQVLCECPRVQNSLLHGGGETRSALVSGLGKVLERESWVLIPAQFLTPRATRAPPPARAGPQGPHL